MPVSVCVPGLDGAGIGAGALLGHDSMPAGERHPPAVYFLSAPAGAERSLVSRQATAVTELRRLLQEEPDILCMPCCFDAFSARLIQQGGFHLTFMSGFAVAAARLGLPDTGLISYAEMVDQGRAICEAVSIPVIGDGDTGYGNEVNVQRTLEGYLRAGFAGIMIEDQRSPKRCGHTAGKEVVDRDEAFRRIRAAVEARERLRARDEDILILARTDARGPLGLREAIDRARGFSHLGADILFVEAPRTHEEMRTICGEAPGWHLVNIIPGGLTPVLPPAQLQEMGFRLAAYPLALLSAAGEAMREALAALRVGQVPKRCLSFETVREIAGFPDYDATLQRLGAPGPDPGA